MSKTSQPGTAILPTLSGDEMRKKAEELRALRAKPPEPPQQPQAAPVAPPAPPPAPTTPPTQAAAPAPQQAAPTPAPAPKPPAQPLAIDVRTLKPVPKTLGQAATETVAGGLVQSAKAPEAVKDIAKAVGVDPETQRMIDAQSELRRSANERFANFLKARGWEEQVFLLPEGIDLGKTRQQMEASGLQKEARRLGYNNWYEVPAGPEREKAEADVVERVRLDLDRATTAGRGAILIDPDPARTEATIAALPIPYGQKAALTALVPTAKATFTPTGMEFQPESPLAYPLRAVNTIGSAAVAPFQTALEEADPVRRVAELKAQQEEGSITREDYLAGVGVVMADSIKAATGLDLYGADWRDVFERDPAAVAKVLERVQQDPAAFMLGDALADDLVEYFDAPDFLTHALLIGGGFAMDIITPDPVTPAISAAGQALKAGARLSGDSDDLLDAARALRSAASDEGLSAEEVLRIGNEKYRGTKQALEVRFGSKMRIPTDISAQIRRLESEAEQAAERATKAQARYAEAVGEKEQAEAAQAVLSAKRDAARAEMEAAEAANTLADSNRTVYREVGAPAVRDADRLKKASEEATAEARRIEEEILRLQREHEQPLGRLDAQNRALQESMARRDDARAALQEAEAALKEARAAKKAKAPAASGEGPVVGFTTSKGSTYEVDGNTTRRTKAKIEIAPGIPDPRHEGDHGLKAASEITYYADDEYAGRLSTAGLEGIPPNRQPLVVIEAAPDGSKIATAVWWDTEKGSISAPMYAEMGPVRLSTEPGIGKTPIELWSPRLERDGARAYGKIHVGHPITEIRRGTPSAAGVASSQELSALDEQVAAAKSAMDREEAELIQQRQRIAALRKPALPAPGVADLTPDDIAEVKRRIAHTMRASTPTETLRPAAIRGSRAVAQYIAENSTDPVLRHIASRLGRSNVPVSLYHEAGIPRVAEEAAIVRAKIAALDPELDTPDLGWVLRPSRGKAPRVRLENGALTGLHVPVPTGAERIPDEVLVHELVHVETVELLRAPIGDLTPTQQAARADIEALFRHAKATLPGAGMDTYGLKNVDEFVAEAFSNPAFQEQLKSIKPPPGFATSLKSGWSAFIDSLARLLGFGDEPSVLSEVSVALDRMMAGFEVDAAARRAADEVPPSAPETPPPARVVDEPKKVEPTPAEVPPPRSAADRIAEMQADLDAAKARHARAKQDYRSISEQRKLLVARLKEEEQAQRALRAAELQTAAGEAQQRLDRARELVKRTEEELSQVVATHRKALKEAEAPARLISKKTEEMLRLHARAAELEQESGQRIHTILTGMADDAPRVALKDMEIATKAEAEQARNRLGRARDAFREAARAAAKGDKAAMARAEQEIKSVEGMLNTQMKADLAEARAKAWRQEVLDFADEVEKGVEALRKAPKIEPRRNGVLVGSVLEETRDGYLVDTGALRDRLTREYGEQAIRWWVQRAGDDRDLWARALGLDGAPEASITRKEVLRLQMGERGLREGVKRTMPESAAMAQAEALLLVRKDAAFKAADFMLTRPSTWMKHVNDSFEVWQRAMDPTATRIGEVSAQQLEVSKAANRIAANANDEILMLGRLARLPQGLRGMLSSMGSAKDMIDVTIRYIDSVEPLPVFGRNTIFNTGDETLWVRGKWQAQVDPRVATHEQMVKYAQSKGQSLEEMLRSDQPGIANRPLLGLSRMWLKGGVGASERQSAYLFSEARKAIAESNSFQEFSEKMRKATQRAWTDKSMTAGGGFGPGAIEQNPQKAIGYGARCVAQMAAMWDVNQLYIRALGGTMTSEEALDAIKAGTYQFDTIENPQHVWDVYSRMGAPFTQRALRTSSESAVAQTQALLQTGTTRGGEPVFMLSSQARALDETLDRVVKETHEYYAESRDMLTALRLKRIKDFQAWWKTSVTIGMMVPRPAYFMTNVFGNFSQIWLSAGLGTASRISFQSLAYNIPMLGPYIDRATRMASEKMGGVPHLGSMVNALVNPHLNRVFAGESGFFRSANGIDYDFETVRKWMVEDGVMTTFMQEEFSRLFAREQGSSALRRLGFIQDDIYAWAGEIELRMRAALYMDELRKGRPRSEARDVTLRALYDWAGALGPIESSVVTWFIPFYRFIKLGLRQWGEECITLPLRRPTEATYRAVMGQSGLARVNQQMKLTTIPEIADDGDYQDDQAKLDAMARYRGVDFLDKRVYWAERNDPEMVELLRGTRGKYLPYSMIALPGMTSIDMGALAVLPFYAVAAVAAKAATLTGRAMGDNTPEFLAPDWSDAFGDAIIQMNGPLTQPLFASMFGSERRKREVVALKPSEAYLAQMVGLPAHVGPDYQGVVGTAATKTVVNSIPLLLQAPSWMDAFALENPYAKNLSLENEQVAQDIGKFFAFGSRQMSGVGKRYPFDPDATVTQHQRAVGDAMRKVAEQQAAPLREKQSPEP